MTVDQKHLVFSWRKFLMTYYSLRTMEWCCSSQNLKLPDERFGSDRLPTQCWALMTVLWPGFCIWANDFSEGKSQVPARSALGQGEASGRRGHRHRTTHKDLVGICVRKPLADLMLEARTCVSEVPCLQAMLSSFKLNHLNRFWVNRTYWNEE